MVRYLHLYGGIFPPSASGWKNSTMLYPPFWWNFSTCFQMVEIFFHLLVYGGNIFHLLADGGKISTKKGGMFPPASRWWKFFPPACGWWKNSTISKEVEKYNHGISTCLGGISHHLQAGGTILPYQGKHLLIIGVPSVNTVEWCAHQCHCLINNQIPIKSLYRPKHR